MQFGLGYMAVPQSYKTCMVNHFYTKGKLGVPYPRCIEE